MDPRGDDNDDDDDTAAMNPVTCERAVTNKTGEITLLELSPNVSLDKWVTNVKAYLLNCWGECDMPTQWSQY